MSNDSAVHPPVYWAQRKNLVYLRFAVEDCKDPVIKLDNKKLYFKGTGGTEKKVYEATLDLFGKVKPDESKYHVRDRGTEFVLVKDEEGPFWKRLLSDETKHHWIKVDFNKWKDEDSEDEGDNYDFDEMMRQMQGTGAGDDDLKDDDEETDEDMPELEA